MACSGRASVLFAVVLLQSMSEYKNVEHLQVHSKSRYRLGVFPSFPFRIAYLMKADCNSIVCRSPDGLPHGQASEDNHLYL